LIALEQTRTRAAQVDYVTMTSVIREILKCHANGLVPEELALETIAEAVAAFTGQPARIKRNRGSLDTIQDIWDERRFIAMETKCLPQAIIVTEEQRNKLLIEAAMLPATSMIWNRETGDEFRLFNCLIITVERMRR